MFRVRNLLRFLYRTSLIALLSLCIIMLLHILIMTLGTSFMLWHTDSTPFDIALLTFLYYVIPFITLFCFHFFISQLVKLEEYAYTAKRSKQIAKSRMPRTAPTTPHASNPRTTKNHPNLSTASSTKNRPHSSTRSTNKNRPSTSSYTSKKKALETSAPKRQQRKKGSTYTAYVSNERSQN